MSIIMDEFGTPYVLVKEQEKKKRLTGLMAIKDNITAARSVSKILKTSFGPKGMDKIIVNQDGDVTVTNDGAEILEKMDVDHEIAKLMVQLSRSQDEEIGDGTTGVIILAGSLLEEALSLLEKKIHPRQISKGFDSACAVAIDHLNKISQKLDEKAKTEPSEAQAKTAGKILIPQILKTVETTLSSKLVRNEKKLLAKMAVDAVLSVADLDRKDVNFELIRVEGKEGSSLEESMLIDGICLEKSMAHSQMPKEFSEPKVALLTCAFEPPKPKTKHFVEIESVEHYKQLYKKEQDCFRDMVRKCKESGADIVFCQWGFDDEATHLLLKHEMPAVRWVGGGEMESLAIATGAKIVGRFEDLSAEKLGTAKRIKEISFGNSDEKVLLIEDCPNKKTVTIFLRAGNKMALDEAKRCVHDCLCVARNLVRDGRVVCGGGSCELSSAAAVRAAAKKAAGLHQYGFRAFAAALESVPLALAENAGLPAIEMVSKVSKAQKLNNSSSFGIGADSAEPADMWKEGVFETLSGKKQQLQLAAQLAKMVLKTDDIITSENSEFQ